MQAVESAQAIILPASMAGTTKRVYMGKEALILSVLMRERLVTTVNVGIGVPACCFRSLGCIEDQVRCRHMWLALPNGRKEEDFYHFDLSSFCRTVPSKKFLSPHAILNQPNRIKMGLAEAFQSGRKSLRVQNSTM